MAIPDHLEYTIGPVTSPEEFSSGYVDVEAAAFSGDLMDLMFPGEEAHAFSAKVHADTLANDPSVRYCTAKLPSGKIVGIAKWNFFLDSEPQYPWPNVYPPGANVEMIKWFFGRLDEERNKALAGKKHALMAVLAIQPEYQKRGIGGKLLEWGLKKCDEERLECWIDASEKGKGLYLRHHWVPVGEVDIDEGRWGGEEGKTRTTLNMLRQAQPLQNS